VTSYQTVLIWTLIFGVGTGLAFLSHIGKKLDTIIDLLKSKGDPQNS
jgi:hypothetical protein